MQRFFQRVFNSVLFLVKGDFKYENRTKTVSYTPLDVYKRQEIVMSEEIPVTVSFYPVFS